MKLKRVDLRVIVLLQRGFTHAKIAERLHVDRSAVTYRVIRIRRKIKRHQKRLNRLKGEESFSVNYGSVSELLKAQRRVRRWHEWFLNQIVARM